MNPHSTNQTPSVREIGREEEAKQALEHTKITRAVAWLLTLAFLATIVSVPLLQHVVEIGRNLEARRAHASLVAKNPQADDGFDNRILPRSYDVLQELPSWQDLKSVRSVGDAWRLVPDASRFKEHENALQDDSVVVQWTLPRVQNWLIGVGVGNEQAYCGRIAPSGRQWLHYRADVDYVTSRGFLDPSMQRVRLRSGEGDAVQPDPVAAIVDFQRQLQARGIELVVMPMPVKAMMQPETLSDRYAFAQGVLQNPSYADFAAQLQRAGVKVFDVSPLILAQMRRTSQAQYLETDTHWTPPAMELAARELAVFIGKNVQLPVRANIEYSMRSRDVSNVGDIAEMLKLPPNQTRFRPQTVRVHPIYGDDGELWYPTRSADILLLGDSFCNIYSLGGMNWGEGAGFGEHLSFALKRPLDCIINNAGGSHVTRERLVKELARGRNRLKRKRLVIWEFAMRDLLSGDWKILKLPAAS